MILAAFLQAANCSNYAGSWRHPESDLGFLHPRFYQEIARTLERGKFHLAFIDDRLAMPSRLGESFRESVRHGIRTVKLDLIPAITAMGLATEHLGLGATYSTTYYPPYHIARLFATLDHMTGGRIAWNVVTSLNDSEARNFGMDAAPDHDQRYDQADELLDIVTRLWETWDEDALVMDRKTGLFAQPEKVHELNYAGQWFNAQGPLTVPPSPQGRPVLIQAGQSNRGRDFAARWGELIFTIYPTAKLCKAFREDVRGRAASLGRNPEQVFIAPAIYVIVAETEQKVRKKRELIEGLAHPMDSLVLLAEVFNYDFGRHELDEPIPGETIASLTGLRGFIDRVINLSGKSNPTVRDFLHYSGRGTLAELPLFVGTPQQVCDGLAEWFHQGACDGFVVAATHVPGAYEDFVNLVVPELQNRGLYHRDYTGYTLRESLGLSG